MGEKKKRKKSIIRITRRYLIIAAVISAVLIMSSYYVTQMKIISRESAGLINSFEETFKYMKDKEADTTAEIENDFCVSARLTASAIRTSSESLEPGRYRNGWIIRREGGGIELPEGFPENIDLSGLTLPDDYSSSLIDGNDVSCAKIRGEYYYVEYETASEEKKVIEQGVNVQKALDNIASASDYDFISLNASDEAGSGENADYVITAATGKFTKFSSSSELGLNEFLGTISAANAGDEAGQTAEAGDTGSGNSDAPAVKVLKIKGKYYLVYGTKSFVMNYEPDDAAVMLVPLHDIVMRTLAFTMVMLFLLMILCCPMAVWLISIFRRYSSGYFTEEQMESYSYEVIKRKVIIIAGLCTIIAFAGAFFSMSLDRVFLQTSRGTSTLTEYFNRLDDDRERTDIQWESSQERYIQNAKRLASLIDTDRNLQNERWLAEASGIIGADYIMIFDENGDELISDSQYKRISLKNRENPEMADFSRLLNGVESISHAGVEDEVTGLTRDYHGICLRNIIDDKDSYGALLIAVDPEEHTLVQFGNADNVAASIAPENGFIIGANPKTRIITNASSRKFIGKRLKKAEIDDSYLGMVTIGWKPYIAVSSAYDDKYYYYGVEEKHAMRFVLPVAAGYALLTLLVLGILCLMLLRNSPHKSDEAEIINSYTRKKLDKLSAFILRAAEKNDRLLRLNNDRLNVENTKDYYYRNVTPEREALSTFELLLFLYILSVGGVVIARNMSSHSGQTVLDFLFTGKWTHGLNLFSLAAVFFLFCILFVILAFMKAVSAVLSQVLSKKSLTICSLIMNILFYASLLAFIFISLGCLGVNAKALLASAGFVGLAVSMSFRDIISDILAGIVVITSRTFEVGDYIEIKDASSGTVTSMGLIRTELVSKNGKTFSIRNSQIKKVTNHSRMAETGETGDGSPSSKGKQS